MVRTYLALMLITLCCISVVHAEEDKPALSNIDKVYIDVNSKYKNESGDNGVGELNKFYSYLISELEKLANNDDVDAMFELAILYSNNVPGHDYEKGVYWFKRAGLLGDMTSQLTVATLYMGGYVPNVSRADAIRHALLWYSKATESGAPTAMVALATLRVRLATGNWTSTSLELKDEIIKEVNVLSVCMKVEIPLTQCKVGLLKE